MKTPLLLTTLGLATNAAFATGLPPVQSQNVTPAFSSTSQSVASLLSPTRYLAPRYPFGLLKPFAGTLTTDSGNSAFATNRTYYMAFELPLGARYTAVRALFGNQSTSPYTITDFSVAASSQWGSTQYGTPGVSSFDASSNQNTLWSVGAFENGGNAVETVPPVVSGACLSASASTAGSSTLNLASSPITAGWTANAPLVSYQDPVGIVPGTQISGSITSTSVGLSQPISQYGVFGGTSVCQAPISQTVAAAANGPRQSVVYSDWVDLPSQARVDSPLTSATVAYLQNGTSLGAISSHSATTVTLATRTPSFLPKGTKIGFCQATTTSNAVSVQNVLTFASVPSTVVVGARVTVPASLDYFQTPQPSSLTVTGVTSTTVTLSGGVPYNASGTQYQFETPMTVTAVGSNTVTVSSVPSNVATGMAVEGTGIPLANGTFANGATISGIAGNVLTLSGTVDSTSLHAGDTIAAVVVLTTNASVATPSVTAATTGALPGDWVIGAGLPVGTVAVSPTNTAFGLSQSPTATVSSGSTLYVCDPLSTSQDAAAGSNTLSFATTNYPQNLVLMRINLGSATTSYWYVSGAVGQIEQANWAAAGLGRYEAGYCGTGNDGVLAPTSISNTTGGCARNLNFPVWALEFKTNERSVIVPVAGDSHFQGYTTLAQGNLSFVQAGLAPLSSPQTPIWTPNFGRSGRNSDTFFSDLMTVAQTVPFSAPVLAGYSWNDAFTASGFNHYGDNLAAAVQAFTARGQTPLVATEFARAVKGCDSIVNATGQSNVTAARTSLLAAAQNNGVPVFDLFAAAADPNNANMIAPGLSNDCIHLNAAAMSAVGAAFAKFAAPYLGL